MNEHLKFTSKLIGKISLSFIKINVIGQLTALLISIISLITLVNQSGSESGFFKSILELFTSRPFAISIVLLLIIAIPFILFSFGNKYLISKIIHLIIAEKGEKVIYPILDTTFNKIKSTHPPLVEKGADFLTLKLKFLQEIKSSTENKWVKKAITYGFSKIEINENDLQQENVDFGELIKIKVMGILKEISEPDKLFFWIILGINSLVLTLIILKVI
ncbi:MAG: hypothetical protein QM535_20350 [Limnohabitans sp.]|nr:hypothetical protein [Limnohabitans sp.]